MRRCLSALPNAIELVAGTPSRKSAKSEPLKAPVNANPPRGFCCDSMSMATRRTSPPNVKLWRPWLQYASMPPPYVRVRLKFGSASLSPVIVENERLGGPQLTGSWLLPVIPARPETFVRFAKYGVDDVVNSVNCPRGRMVRNWLTRWVHVSEPSMPEIALASSNPNSVVCVVRLF